VPAIDGDGIARLFVVVGEDGGKLFERDVGGKFVVAIVKPGFRIEGGVVSSTDGIVPTPRTELAVRWMASEKSLCDSFGIAFGLLKHGELIRVDRLVFVNAGLHMPASEVAAKGSRKSSGAETADRSALPEAVVDVSAVESEALDEDA